MNTYLVCITVIGIASLGMAWMPAFTKKTRISYAIFYVVFGAVLYTFVPGLPKADPLYHKDIALHLSELVVIVSIMGTGLKIDDPFTLKKWRVPFRLVTITMLLSICSVAWIAWYFLKLDVASSILLGAVLAPTDPVLASDVQVGPPQEDDTDNVKFSLTAEAGMNDGMAFPFTWLAIIIAGMDVSGSEGFSLWFARDVLYRMAAGVFIGYAMGRLLAYLVIYLPEKKNFVAIKDGFVAISATLLLYGITELVNGYGFIAVFVTAITLRNSEMGHNYHKKLHSFTDQIERILVAIILILFGGALVSGILKSLTTELVIFALIFIFLTRPITAFVSLINIRMHIKEKFAISFFGIRGVGSFFYLSFALLNAGFKNGEQLWAMVSFIVLISILIHGLSATTVMGKLEKRFTRNRNEDEMSA